MRSTSVRQPPGLPGTRVLIFDPGDEVVEVLTSFAIRDQLGPCRISALGAFSEAVVGFFDRGKKDYLKIPISEQVEVLVMEGDIVLKDGKPQVHAHVVLGKADGSAHGGHLLSARVWPTLELVLVETPAPLVRELDRESGLALIRVQKGNSSR